MSFTSKTGRAAAAMAALLLVSGMQAAHAGDRRKGNGSVQPAVIYHNYCSVCHGDNGDGKSRARGSLIPPPADFTDLRLKGRLTREYIAAIVAHGKPGTAMVGWTTQLTDAEIAAVADYVRTSFVDHAGDVVLVRGRTVYGHLCAGCHGVDGRGATPAVAGQKPPRDLTTAAMRAELTRERIVAAIAVGRKGTSMSGFAGQLSPEDLGALADYVRGPLMTQSAGISGTSAHGGRARDAGLGR